jgi:hypothetical protein
MTISELSAPCLNELMDRREPTDHHTSRHALAERVDEALSLSGMLPGRIPPE